MCNFREQPAVHRINREQNYPFFLPKINAAGAQNFDSMPPFGHWLAGRTFGLRVFPSRQGIRCSPAEYPRFRTRICMITLLAAGTMALSFVAAGKSTSQRFAPGSSAWASYIAEASRRFDVPANWIGAVLQLESDSDNHALKGSTFIVIDGVNGRAHHIRLPDLDAAGDSEPGSIVELRRYEDSAGRQRLAIAVRSDFPIDIQATAQGATWLDRQLVARKAMPLSEGGFGHEVHEAMNARIDHLVELGLARRQGQRVLFTCDLLETLRKREIEATVAKLAADTGLPYQSAAEGEHIAGIYRQRVTLASGRYLWKCRLRGSQSLIMAEIPVRRPSIEQRRRTHVLPERGGTFGYSAAFHFENKK